MIEVMDLDQLEIYNLLYTCANEEDETHQMTTFSIEGKPGRGKTFIADAFANKLRSEATSSPLL